MAASSALDVYDDVQDYLISINSPRVIPNSADVLTAFLYIYNVQVSGSLTGMNYYDVASVIQQNRPIYAGLSKQSNPSLGHAVVICGYQSGAGYYYYKIMDPNASALAWIPVSSYGTNFSVTTGAGSITFDVWERHYY